MSATGPSDRWCLPLRLAHTQRPFTTALRINSKRALRLNSAEDVGAI